MNEFVDSGNLFPSFPSPWYHACFVQKITFILRKIHKNCCHMSCSFWLKYAPNRLSADPTGGAYRAPQAVFRGPTSKGGGGRREGRGGEGREEFVLCPRKKKKSRRLWISAQYQLLNGHIITAQQTDNIQRYGYGYWPSMDGLLHLVQPGRA